MRQIKYEFINITQLGFLLYVMLLTAHTFLFRLITKELSQYLTNKNLIFHNKY